MASKPVLEFLLVPDSSAARRVRRALAADAHCGVVAGTWPQLIARARDAYLLPEPTGGTGEVEQALDAIDDAFWSESYSSAPEETARAVRDALIELLSASHPGRHPELQGGRDLSLRARRMIGDLRELAAALDGSLPGDLASIQCLLRADPGDAPQPVRVHRIRGFPQTTRWQDALITKLNRDASLARPTRDVQWAGVLKACLRAEPRGKPGSALAVLQARLFNREEASAVADPSVQWVRVRDFYQEAEIVAGMVQTLLAANPELRAADVGLLVPDSFEYSVALEDAFRLAGLPLSGLAGERWRRDLGAEAVFHFLFCRQKPAPAMAQAVCLSSVLMPWSTEDGAQMAQRVMDGRYRLKAPEGAGPRAQEMIGLIEGGDTEPATLLQALRDFASLLDGGDRFADHLRRAREAAARACARLEAAKRIDWPELRRAVTPRYVRGSGGPTYNLEGVTIWSESREPWRDVRHLFVLGFAHGRYPIQSRPYAMFSEDDILAMRDHLDLALELPSDKQDRLRRLFRHQLRAASDSATFMIPHRGPDGSVQAPSDSLVFMRRLISKPESAADLILELDSADDRERIRHLAVASSREPSPPRALRPRHLLLGRDLLRLRTDSDGRILPESPSSLELPLISPLAWLLRRLDAEPLNWAPESDNPLVVGTLAHSVFEKVFRPGIDLPSEDDIRSRVTTVLEEVAAQQAPFFRGPHWHVERRNLAKQAGKSAAAWRFVLGSLGAEVLASEQWLEGEWSGIPIHGKADLILGLEGNKLLIVDYKWSKSESRRKRMELGYESQASLYRAMAQTGGLKSWDGESSVDKTLAARLRAATWIGIAYYTMRDQVCLSDSSLPGYEGIRGWHAVDEDVTREASAIIRERLAELRTGAVRLNLATDRGYFEKECGIHPFALDASPLIELYALPAAGRG